MSSKQGNLFVLDLHVKIDDDDPTWLKFYNTDPLSPGTHCVCLGGVRDVDLQQFLGDVHWDKLTKQLDDWGSAIITLLPITMKASTKNDSRN